MAHAAPAWGRAGRALEGEGGSAATETRRRSKPRRRFPPEVLTDEEVLRLLNCLPGTHTGVRNRALLALLYRGGLRLGEALKLRPKYLDLEAGTVRVLYAKGG